MCAELATGVLPEQDVQLLEPVLAAIVLPEQVVHVDVPEVDEYFPAAHDVHVDADDALEYLPVAQTVHAEADADENVPALQDKHDVDDVAGEAECVPALHPMQLADVELAYWPREHVTQYDDDVAPMTPDSWPDGQDVHILDPADAE